MSDSLPDLPQATIRPMDTSPSVDPPATGEDMDRLREIILGTDPSNPRFRPAEVDRLRQILFAPQMEDYERRFTDMQRALERMLSDARQIQDHMAEFEKSQTRRSEALEVEIRRIQEDGRRDGERQRTREHMVQQLLTTTRQQELMGQNLAESTNELRTIYGQHETELRSLRSGTQEQREQQDRRLELLRREIRQAEDSMRSELHRVASRLNDQKTDRKSLAAMLIEIATRLETGSTVTGLLEELSGSSRG